LQYLLSSSFFLLFIPVFFALFFFFLLIPPPPTSTLFPYTTLFRSRGKILLDRDVILLAEAGEEGTTQFGIDFMVARHWDKIDCRSEEHTSELQSLRHLVCRLLLEKKKKQKKKKQDKIKKKKQQNI